MSLEALTERILSDAEKEAEEMVASAREKAELIEAEAREEARKNRVEEEEELSRRIQALRDGSAATVRLETKKFELSQRRRVIDTIYARALDALFALPERESMELLEMLLSRYAEAGDEVALSEDYPYPAAAEKLIGKKGYKVSSVRAKVRGGFYLYGKKCDRDISYTALLNADREKHQADISAKIFRT